MAGYFVFYAVTFRKILKSFLIIDEKGIHGVCCVDGVGLRMNLQSVAIQWEQVSKAKMMSPITIAFFKNGLKFPEQFEDFAELAEVDGIEQGTSVVILVLLAA